MIQAELARQQRALPGSKVARVLVRHASKHSANARELFENLAAHIDDAESRRLFVEQADLLA